MRLFRDGCHFLLTVFVCLPGVLLLAGQAAAQCTPAAEQASQPGEPALCVCRIGPVTAEVPTCDIKTESLEEERVEYIDWKNKDGIWHHIKVITPNHPRSFKGYLNQWRDHRKCTANEKQIGSLSRFEASTDLGDSPPQVTWAGCYAAPECYIARAIAAGNQVIELQGVELNVNAGPSEPLAEAFAGLVAQVHLSRPPSR